MAVLNLGAPHFGNNSTSYSMSFSGYTAGKWVLSSSTYDTDTKLLSVVLTYNRSSYNSQGVYASLNNDRTSMGNSSNYTSVGSNWGASIGTGEYYAIRKTSSTTVNIYSGDTSNISYLKLEGGASSGSGVTGVTLTVSSVVSTDAILAGTVPFYIQAIYGSGWKPINNARWIGTEGGYSQKYLTTLKFPNNTSTFTYDIVYDANGGSGAPAAQEKDHGKSITLSSTKPTRTGYTFKNWNTARDGSGTSYAAGATFATDAHTTLYAQWTINTYTVSYNANGGSGAPAAQTKTYDVSLVLSSTKPTRTGYVFQGWGTSTSDTSVDYAPGAYYTANAAITLYAIWKLETYTVAYNANGGSGAPNSQTKTYGTALTLSSTKPSKDSTTATGYTVTFNANGGACDTTAITSTKTTNYTFSSWNTNANGTGTSYQSGGSYTANTAATLYAQWASSTVNNSIKLPTAAMGGYILLGWSTSASGSVLSGTTYTPTSNITLYAQWQLVPKITRIYARSGTSFISDPLVKVKVNGNWHIVTNIKTRNSSGNF